MLHESIEGHFVFLGTGTSHGVPMIGCGCDVCTSDDPRNQRTRCAVALGLPEGTLLIDTPPELRLQLTRERIGLVDAVLMTHAHADHLFGLDDVRIFPRYTDRDVPIYCTEEVGEHIRRAFEYAFDEEMRHYPAGGVPRITIETIDDEPFEVLGGRAIPLPLEHGCFRTTGYRFGDIAYCTDVKRIPPKSYEQLRGLEVLVLDCLRREPHIGHLCLEEALAIVDDLRPRMTYFTHIAHQFDHGPLEAELPSNVRLAYDGLRIPLPL